MLSQDSVPFPFFVISVLLCEYLLPHRGMKKAEMGSA